MKASLQIIAAATLLSLSACSPPPPTAEATPVPVPAETPHPAAGATQQAIRLYPDLAKKDSMFNRTFLDLLEQRKKQSPHSLTFVDWPLELANQTGRILGVAPKNLKATPMPTPTPGALDRGAYGRSQGVSRRPTYVSPGGYQYQY